MAKMEYHPAQSRGKVDHGWLQSHHSFSFANYYNPDRMGFGLLRVINDDQVAPGMGFHKHPHQNMEIISIVLHGALAHRDSMGNASVIQAGDVQVMSAGSGVTHSEFNHSQDEKVEFLQIWIYPNQQDVEPRYGQMNFNSINRKNQLYPIISPYPGDGHLWIHQQAWFYLASFDSSLQTNYTLQQTGNGIYIFNLSGTIEVNGQRMETRDGLGISETQNLTIQTLEPSEFLLMEIPMKP